MSKRLLTLSVCDERDEFVGDLYWRAQLSDGSIVYSDDNRPGEEIASAWIRLGHYLKHENLSIALLSLHFRSNAIEIEQSDEGYYFSHGVWAMLGSESSAECYVIGTLKDGIIHLKWYLKPELIVVKEEDRPEDKGGICLIKKNDISQDILPALV